MLKCDVHVVPERSVREVLENLLSSVLSKKTYSFEDKNDLLTVLESFYHCPVCSRQRSVNRNLSDISINSSSVDNGVTPELNKHLNAIQIYSPFSYKINHKSFDKIPLKISFDIPDNYQLNFYQNDFFSRIGLHMVCPLSNPPNKNIILFVYNLSEEDIFISRKNLLGYFVPYYSPKIINVNHSTID